MAVSCVELPAPICGAAIEDGLRLTDIALNGCGDTQVDLGVRRGDRVREIGKLVSNETGQTVRETALRAIETQAVGDHG